jgi:TRAP-type C4-dicarboxylate transport system substrate-binding protein
MPSYVFSNHFTAAKYYSLTEHLIIPEVMVFSKRSWATLSSEDQNLVKKFAREAQLEERDLWNKYEAQAMEKAKAAGCVIVEIADKAPFQNAVKPVWDKYGPKYADMIKRIQAV